MPTGYTWTSRSNLPFLISDIRHSGTESQSARMSGVKNGGLDLDDIDHFEM